jgi:regulator of RNase E activity RraB
MAANPPKVVYDQWEVYVTEMDEAPFFVAVDVEAAQQDLTDTLTHCARVLIPIQNPNNNGGPVSPESEHLYEMEDALCRTLAEHGVLCRLVGRVTFKGMRELVFQLDDYETFRPPVGLWMGEISEYEIDVSEHEGWDFFDTCIRPTPDIWRRIADQQVITNLIDAGSDPQKPHSLEFVFLGEPEGLEQMFLSLNSRGYRPLSEPDFESGEIIMVKEMTLDIAEVCEESRLLAEMADEIGIDYDGWGCAVVK